MRVQQERKAVWAFAIVTLTLLFAVRSFDQALTSLADSMFLYNRCYQMCDCIKHGVYPFLYHNDAQGLGYASPIFYGQLTLVPFIPFLYSFSVFMKVYMLCALLLNFFGFRFFAKRFSANATLASCFFIMGYPFLWLINSGTLYAFIFGLGISWFFLGYCVDYFRDKKHFSLLLLTYFLTWQSNLNIAFLALVVCFGFFCLYFRIERIKDYVKLSLCAFVMLLYNFVNMAVHAGAVHMIDLDLFLSDFVIGDQGGLSSVWPVGGFIVRRIGRALGCLSDSRVGLLQVLLVVLFVVGFVKCFKSETKRYKICFCVFAAGTAVLYVIGLLPVWERIWDAVSFIQVPIRFLVILLGLACVFLSRLVKPGKFVYCCLSLLLVDCLFGCVVSTSPWVMPVDDFSLYMQIGNAEYAGENFVRDWDWHEANQGVVLSESGAVYDYVNDYIGLSVDCSANFDEDVLTLPKLYYKGYRCVDAYGRELEVISGYSNYCQVDIGGYTGILTLKYSVPWWLVMLLLVQVAVVGVLTFDAVRRRFR